MTSQSEAAVSVHRGTEADSLISSDAFTTDWMDLGQRCPWTTAFQLPAFARTWYRTYHERFEPVLVTARSPDGGLSGLMPLARQRVGGALVAAGSHHAEYQGWICLPEIAQAFPRQAMRSLRAVIPASGIRFRYLAPGMPVDWVEMPDAHRECLLVSSSRPLLRLDDGGKRIEYSLSKSGNKSRLRQLKKIGPVELVRISDPTELIAPLDMVVDWYDARSRLVCGSAPFKNDPCKQPFHVAMLREPGLIHASVLKVGEQIASVHLNVCKGKELQLGLIAHNPRFARLSPGKLHLLLLGRLLVREGMERIDLTPGGDQYKERFATDHDDVHTLTCFATVGWRRLAELKLVAKNSARRMLGALHVTPGKAAALAAKARWSAPAAVLAGIVVGSAHRHGHALPANSLIEEGSFRA